jgi:hypothetical protein
MGGGGPMKKCSLSGVNGSKRIERKWKMMEDEVVQELREPMKILESGAFR